MTHTHHSGLLRTFCLKMNYRHYAKVFIWDSPESMWAANPKRGDNYYGLATAGIAFVTRTGKINISRKFGEIHLYQNGYDFGTVAHELMHLVNYWIQRRKWDLDKYDERIASLCGNLNNCFWKEHYKIYQKQAQDRRLSDI